MHALACLKRCQHPAVLRAEGRAANLALVQSMLATHLEINYFTESPLPNEGGTMKKPWTRPVLRILTDPLMRPVLSVKPPRPFPADKLNSSVDPLADRRSDSGSSTRVLDTRLAPASSAEALRLK
jgi:hypothetical protein